MAKLARLPANDRAPEAAPAEVRRVAGSKARYFAFLSYSHKDEELASWLHRELEDFRVPANLVGRLTENGAVPRRLTPIFRDAHELAAADDLGMEIVAAIAASQFLIVLCSPDAARSHWTNAEIEAFKRSRPEGCVLAAIAAGEPFASDIPGREQEECFPPALRQKFDRRGRPTGKRAEPLAADLRADGESRRLGLIKLVAGMLGVGLDDLLQRENTRRQRRLAGLAAASLIGMTVAIALAVTAIQARDSARDQRREAEGLVAFMLGDLKDKLEPIGRLDALDGVGARVLDYYSKQDSSELSDAALLQRARALSLMGEVASLRGDLNTAQRLYREAADGTAEAVRRDPGDPQRLFDHAQNVYYFGDLAARRGAFDGAEAAFRDYRRLADRMVEIQPDNLKWRMEVQYAEANLGIVLLSQRRFADAARQFDGALRTIQAVAAVDPDNGDYEKSVAESLAWLADSELAEGKLDSAIRHRRQQVALLERLAEQPAADVEYQQKLIPARQGLGHLLALTGDIAGALAQLQASVAGADALLPKEPDNTRWSDFAASAKLEFASLLRVAGQLPAADRAAGAGCAIAERLLASNGTVVNWQTLSRSCLVARAENAFAAGTNGDALALARRALEKAKAIQSGDRVADAFAIAGAYRLVGDIEQAMGDRPAATAAWSAGAAAIPSRSAERPEELSERAQLLQRLGRHAEYAQIAQRLSRTGVRTGAAAPHPAGRIP
jgi:tetratricopeptide (TPR) repeat protein